VPGRRSHDARLHHRAHGGIDLRWLSFTGAIAPDGLHTGCGQVWPTTLSPTHVDENGNLSPALADVFLPRRADFLATYLRGCDVDAVIASLQPVALCPIVK
jgi:hypothetical protein